MDLFFNDEMVIDHKDTLDLGTDDVRRMIDARTVTALIKEWRKKVGRPVTKSTGSRVDVNDEDLNLNLESDPQLARKIETNRIRRNS